MTNFLQATPHPTVDIGSARVLCATHIPLSSALIYATDTPTLVSSAAPDHRVPTASFARSIATVRYSSFDSLSLPQENTVIIVLIDGTGLQLYSPSLTPVEDDLSDRLRSLSNTSHLFSIDRLGSDLVGESFRIALATVDAVSLVDINPSRNKVTVLGDYTLGEPITAVAFSEMTIVASTTRTHHLLRISRGGGLAVAATVARSDRPRRVSASVAVGDGGAAVMSFIGGFFTRRHLADSISPQLAHALPDNRWLLTVDQELVAYSSFGAKLEEMDAVFKSKTAMDAVTGVVVEDKGQTKPNRLVKSNSVSSLGSLASAVSHMTLLDQSKAARSEKPPVVTIFSSPFVLTVGSENEILVYAANGSVPGVIDTVSLNIDDENKPSPTDRLKLLTTRYDRVIATAYWPNGLAIAIELVDDLENLIEKKEAEKELRLALALVPSDQTNRMIALRRLLATEARAQDWHDAAIHHFQTVVNMSMRTSGSDQIDLVADAVELRGRDDPSWHVNPIVSTMWADFLFQLRRRIMRPSAADVDVLDTLCRADESADRVKALLSVKHEIQLGMGEALIAAPDSALREEERVEALVALYTSLSEHGKALLLLENSELNNSFNGVVGYLSASMRATDNPDVYFLHLKWLAHRCRDEAQGEQKLEKVVSRVLNDEGESDGVAGRLLEVLVEEAEQLVSPTIDKMCPAWKENDEKHETTSLAGIVSADVAAVAILCGMVKADSLEKPELFDKLRSLFGSRIIHRPDASYHSYTLLQALQAAQNKALRLHEEEAFLLGQQGRHEAAADELAAEHGLVPEEALLRLSKMLPASDKSSAAESLIAAYLRVSAQGRAMRVRDASEVLRCGAGSMEVERLLLDGRCVDESLSLSDMRPFLETALVAGNERLRLAEVLRSLRKSEVGRMREEVLSRRRRFVVIGHDRACTLCTRRIGDAVFVAYPDGSVAHLACHMSKDSR